MTEAEWLACGDPGAMLNSARERMGGRKSRLLAAACCRRIEHLILKSKRAYRGVVMAERLADGSPVEEDVRDYRDRLANEAFLWIDGPRPEREPNYMYNAIEAAACAIAELDMAPLSPDTPLQNFTLGAMLGDMCSLSSSLECSAHAVAHWSRRNDHDPVKRSLIDKERAEQVKLAHDILGNPFRPVTFSPEWRTDTVVSLARQMYEPRDFSAMPILADALQDTGCDSEDILTHCRGPGPHVRGCWVVDLVLGKE
jgi:hypothetical protein